MTKKITARAIDETRELLRFAGGLGRGLPLVSMPGAQVKVTDLEILMMGAVARVWGAPLTSAFVVGFLRRMREHTSVQGIGSGMRKVFTARFGDDHPSALGAGEVGKRLRVAASRMIQMRTPLATAVEDAYIGHGVRLARILNRIFRGPDFSLA